MVLKLQYTSLSLDGGLVKTQVPGPCPQSFDSVDLGWGLGTCISNKFPRDIHAPDPGTTFENRQSEQTEPESILTARMLWKHQGIWTKGVADAPVTDAVSGMFLLSTKVAISLLGSYLRGRVCLKDPF